MAEKNLLMKYLNFIVQQYYYSANYQISTLVPKHIRTFLSIW